MDATQLGRRNLSPDAFKLLLGRRYNRVKKNEGGNGSNQHNKQLAQFDPVAPPKSTADRMATEYGISPATVKRAAKFANRAESPTYITHHPHRLHALQGIPGPSPSVCETTPWKPLSSPCLMRRYGVLVLLP